MEVYLLVLLVSVALAGIGDLCAHQMGGASQTAARPPASYCALRAFCISLSAICLVLVEGLRSHVGTDFDLYYREFSYLAVDNGWYVHTDEGFRFLNKVVAWFGLDASALFVVCAAILIAGVYYLAIRLHLPLALAVLVFFVSFNYLQSFSLIAQYTSLGVLCFAAWKAFDRKYLQSTLLVLLAAALHSSSIVFLVVPIAHFLFAKSRRPWRVCCVTIFGAAAVAALIGSIAPLVLRGTRFYVYLVALDFSNLNSNSYVLINVTSFVLMVGIVLSRPKIRKDPMILVFLLLEAVACFFSLAQNQLNLLVRLQMSFSFFLVFSLPVFLSQIEKRGSRQMLTAAVICAFVVWLVLFPIRGNYYEILPYQSVLERPL